MDFGRTNHLEEISNLLKLVAGWRMRLLEGEGQCMLLLYFAIDF